MDATFDELRKKGKKTEKEVESMKKLAREVQAAVLIKKLQPGEPNFVEDLCDPPGLLGFLDTQSCEHSTTVPRSNFLETLEFVSRSIPSFLSSEKTTGTVALDPATTGEEPTSESISPSKLLPTTTRSSSPTVFSKSNYKLRWDKNLQSGYENSSVVISSKLYQNSQSSFTVSRLFPSPEQSGSYSSLSLSGCATLLPNRVDLIPFWLPQME